MAITGLIVASILSIFIVRQRTPGARMCRIAAICGAVLGGYLFLTLYLGAVFNNDLLLFPIPVVGIYQWAVLSLSLLLIGGIGLIIMGTCTLVNKLIEKDDSSSSEK